MIDDFGWMTERVEMYIVEIKCAYVWNHNTPRAAALQDVSSQFVRVIHLQYIFIKVESAVVVTGLIERCYCREAELDDSTDKFIVLPP